MKGCITQDYKDIILQMIDQEADKAVVRGFVQYIPLCEAQPGFGVKTEEAARAKRGVPEIWGIEPVYIDAEGKETTYSSPSALVKELGLKVSGIQCDTEGKSCKAMSVVDILRIHGYTVSGDGEPRKVSEGGEKLTVFHPDAPQMKETKARKPRKLPPKE
jgi:hypothetical protein